MCGVNSPREVVLLGSTGSVGQQAIDVIRRNPAAFRIVALAAGGRQPEELAAQVVEFGVTAVGVADVAHAEAVKEAINAERVAVGGPTPAPTIVAGPDAATELATYRCDVVLNGITGSIGLAPTLAALENGRTLALANKESLVAGGPLVRKRARPGQIAPVDSEHSALAQCLRGANGAEIRKLILTASGGPFRGRTKDQLKDVTLAEALAHPTWDMGPVVTINSATMMNKSLELIEAHELFGVSYDWIDVVVHPQSYVHSMVEFVDGSTMAQCSPPDMRLPISLALGWPQRVVGAAPSVDWTQARSWDFEPLDEEVFPAVALARQVGRAGGLLPAIFNAANEEAVGAFLTERISFPAIVETVERVVADAPKLSEPSTVLDVLDAETWARERAHELLGAVGSYQTGI
ncbi:MAG TPA: 1-deoxy-D-xylulose-5-phosphate reductoisomerase [Mycobacteriales bacterium]|nr:1-deoxy-D-xylulose-5-phosphate reductoisomerase [Mycobacteriales bacterium]